jgi:TatD DNase family protein
MFIDTHCHLDFPDFRQDRDGLIRRCRSEGLGYLINIGSSLEGSRQSVALAEANDFIYAAVGLHPHEAECFSEAAAGELISLASHKKVVAIGEIGLDYYKNYSPRENQQAVFARLLAKARELKLPVIIHCRQAACDLLKIIQGYLPLQAVVHCFSGDEKFLQECLDKGFLVSFTCNITYKKADALRQLVRLTPLEKLMLESDAPFLAPESLRGKRNDPLSVKLLAEEIARLKQVSLSEVANVTTDNAKRFFKLP